MTYILKTLTLSASVLGILSTHALADEPILSSKTQTTPMTTSVDVKLKGYVFGIKIMRARYSTRFTDTDYNARADLYTAGLAALLKKLRIWSITDGKIVGNDLRPQNHVQQNVDKKNRRVQMTYGADAVNVHIHPRLGSQGQPAASPKQRFESDDTLSALMNLMKRGYTTSAEPCSGKIPVFDSKQHYNLRLENAGTRRIRQRGYKGDTIKCHVYYEPVSGFDAEDLPSAEESGTPIKMYLAKFEDAKLYIPVRMTYKISGFKAVIKAREINISHSAGHHVPKMGELNAVPNPF